RRSALPRGGGHHVAAETGPLHRHAGEVAEQRVHPVVVAGRVEDDLSENAAHAIASVLARLQLDHPQPVRRSESGVPLDDVIVDLSPTQVALVVSYLGEIWPQP